MKEILKKILTVFVLCNIFVCGCNAKYISAKSENKVIYVAEMVAGKNAATLIIKNNKVIIKEFRGDIAKSESKLDYNKRKKYSKKTLYLSPKCRVWTWEDPKWYSMGIKKYVKKNGKKIKAPAVLWLKIKNNKVFGIYIPV